MIVHSNSTVEEEQHSFSLLGSREEIVGWLALKKQQKRLENSVNLEIQDARKNFPHAGCACSILGQALCALSFSSSTRSLPRILEAQMVTPDQQPGRSSSSRPWHYLLDDDETCESDPSFSRLARERLCGLSEPRAKRARMAGATFETEVASEGDVALDADKPPSPSGPLSWVDYIHFGYGSILGEHLAMKPEPISDITCCSGTGAATLVLEARREFVQLHWSKVDSLL